MSRTKRKRLFTTLTSLSSTFENCLMSYAGQVERWRNLRPRAKAELEEYRPKGNSSPDIAEFDRRNEQWHLLEGRTVAYLLLLDLYVAVAQNPFPGEKMTLLQTACRIFPDVSGSFSPGGELRGRGYWVGIFREFDLLDGGTVVVFPVEVRKTDIPELERKLLRLACGEPFVLVKVAAEALPWDSRSKAYKYAKVQLEWKGWRWGSRRVEGALAKVIFVPETVSVS
jgi:hypothetical protein